MSCFVVHVHLFLTSRLHFLSFFCCCIFCIIIFNFGLCITCVFNYVCFFLFSSSFALALSVNLFSLSRFFFNISLHLCISIGVGVGAVATSMGSTGTKWFGIQFLSLMSFLFDVHIKYCIVPLQPCLGIIKRCKSLRAFAFPR